MAKASPPRSGDRLAAIAAQSAAERVAAQMALADLPLATFLDEAVVPYEDDEVTRLIIDNHDKRAFAPVSHLTVGGFRDWLLADGATTETLSALARGITPEMAAAVAKICRNQDLIVIAAKCRVVTRFRNTIGLAGRLSSRLQPNHPVDDPKGVLASTIDGLLLGCGDAVIGINPAGDSPERCRDLLCLLDDLRQRLDVPTQSCVLTHVTTTLALIGAGRAGRSRVPVDRRHRGGQPQLRRHARPVGRGARRRALAPARDARRQPDVFRDRPGQRSLRGRPSRLRSADVGSARLWGRARLRALAGEHGGRIHRPGISVRRQRDHHAPAWRIISAASCSACRWVATSATPIMPKPTRTTWTPCSRFWRWPASPM